MIATIQNPYRFVSAGGDPIGDTYALDLGFSMRLLRTGVTHSMKIRRSSDDATTDVELTSSGSMTLSSTVSAGGTLGTWVGSNDGFVDTWYDQSTNGWDATQTVLASQPQIITAGVINTENGLPTVHFSSSKWFNLATFTTTNVGDWSVFMTITYPTVNNIVNYFFSNAANQYILTGGTNASFARLSVKATGEIRGATQNPLPGVQSISSLHPSDVYLDSVADTPYTVDNPNTGNLVFVTFGRRSDIAWYWNGKCQEILIFDADLDTSGDRIDVYDDINAFYGVS